MVMRFSDMISMARAKRLAPVPTPGKSLGHVVTIFQAYCGWACAAGAPRSRAPVAMALCPALVMKVRRFMATSPCDPTRCKAPDMLPPLSGRQAPAYGLGEGQGARQAVPFLTDLTPANGLL